MKDITFREAIMIGYLSCLQHLNQRSFLNRTYVLSYNLSCFQH